MRRSAEFATIVRNGRRVRSGAIVVYARLSPTGEPVDPPRIGLIVGRTVGGSVERHRVSRRLRAQTALRLERLPAGRGMVLRALPAARTANSATLGADLDAALARLEVPA